MSPNPPHQVSTPTEISTTHIVLIPSYNPGGTVFETVAGALEQWAPVWVVVDGSTDGTSEQLQALASRDARLKVLVLPTNQGKGSAVLHGVKVARAAGFTHALTMDSDGQHPAALIPSFMKSSQQHPRALVLGRPVFDASAPMLRVRGRRVSNFWANLETGFAGIGDSLYGFRVYPLADLDAVMSHTRWMRRFDFDPEASVRLVWRGLTPLNIDAPVKYLSSEEGGVSHFQYGRDNVLLTGMHARLFFAALLRAPWLLWKRLTGRPPFGALRPVLGDNLNDTPANGVRR
jgi:glycosyltransferase involved in cell wall biosynthesis